MFSFMLLDQLMWLVYSAVILCSNTYLYRFLKTQTENNIALKETDQKKNRKRNFVPASLGIVHIFLLVLSYSGAMKTRFLNFDSDTDMVIKFSVYIMMYMMFELDTGSRAYILAVYSDLYPAIISPSAILYGAPTIRRKISALLRSRINVNA